MTNVPKLTDDAMQPDGALSQRLNHDKPHWMKPVTGSVVAFKLCLWASGYKFIAQIQTCIIFSVKLFVKHFENFHTIRTLVEDKQKIASSEKDCPRQGENLNDQN